MRLKRFSINNYRSIRSTPRIPVDRNLTIIGPNNEGKSNVIRALVTALRILEEHGYRNRRIGLSSRLAGSRMQMREEYQWTTDYPIDLQGQSDANTRFYLEFLLDDQDVSDFLVEVGSTINGFLPIEIIIDQKNIPYFEEKNKVKLRRY